MPVWGVKLSTTAALTERMGRSTLKGHMFARRQALGSFGKVGTLGFALALAHVLCRTPVVDGAPPKPAVPEPLPWPTIAVKDIRPGMTGYGLTVFSGTKPERFPVRVVGVLPKHTSLMDIILVESDDPRLKHSGIVAGMSGSPIYFDGKLAGALSLGWAFSKDALGGVTPIGYMAADLSRPLRGRDHNHIALRTAESTATEGSAVAALHRGLPPSTRHLGSDPLLPATVPLLVSGLGPQSVETLQTVLSPYGIAVMQGGGSAAPTDSAPRSFEPGSAIAVELVRGDVSMQSIGTVTAVTGSRVLAFGHPMLNAGETYFPVATAEITSFMPSLISSFKFGHSLQTVGSLVQDRSAGIIGDTSMVPKTIPVTFSLNPLGQPSRTLRTEMVRHKLLTPILIGVIASQAVSTTASDVADALVRIDSTLKISGFPPLTQTDYLLASDGFSGKMLANSTGVRQLQEVLGNPFEPVLVESLDLKVELLYKPQVADLVSFSLPSDELQPGQIVPLRVMIRPFGQPPEFATIPVEIPRQLAGQTVKVEVQAGPQVKPELPSPDNLTDFVDNLRKGYSGKSLVVTLSTSDEGVTLRGRIVPTLPASVMATLRPGSSSRRGEVQKRLYRTVHDVSWVIQGKQELTIQIKDLRDDMRSAP